VAPVATVRADVNRAPGSRKGNWIMTSAKHTHTVHIDAPVEKVFAYVADPKVLMETYAGNSQAEVVKVNHDADGVVTSYEVRYRELGMHLTAVLTREEYVVNERITEHSSMGPVWTISVAPEGTGTALILTWDASRLMKLIDAVFFHSDRDFESVFASIKRDVEALP
jgi:uncharacterized protein YndB with AHSA1/START domain